MAPSNKAKPKRPWQEIARESRKYRDASIATFTKEFPANYTTGDVADLLKNSTDIPSGFLQKRDLQITETLPEELVKLLANGELTATEVTTAFLRRAALAQRLMSSREIPEVPSETPHVDFRQANCITELLSDPALARAEELDTYLHKNGRPIGPLHGLPISVKEMIGMKDLGLNAGRCTAGQGSTEDAHVLQILWNAGAVFHAKTTQPQSMMHLETDSNLYGVTVNPYNWNVSSGGSSGGEGALIGMRGSSLGIGSDTGVSMRCSAANCGIYGFKPTAFRLPTDGWCSTIAGADPLPGVIGPISTSLECIKLFMKTVINTKPWLQEPVLTPIRWNSDFSVFTNRPLKIAVMWNDGVVTPHPPIDRALHEIVARLRTITNVEVVDWKLYLHDEAWAIISSLYFTDGGAEDTATIAESGEPWRPLTTWMLKENPCVQKLNPKKVYYWQGEREAYRKEYAKMWNDTATGRNEMGHPEGMVDAILCPVGPGVAPKQNTAKYWGYTSQWNLLDYPAVVFPMGNVDKNIDVQPGKYETMSGKDEENWALYDSEDFHSLPISLQLVERRFEDEKVLAIQEYILSHHQ